MANGQKATLGSVLAGAGSAALGAVPGLQQQQKQDQLKNLMAALDIQRAGREEARADRQEAQALRQQEAFDLQQQIRGINLKSLEDDFKISHLRSLETTGYLLSPPAERAAIDQEKANQAATQAAIAANAGEVAARGTPTGLEAFTQAETLREQQERQRALGIESGELALGVQQAGQPEALFQAALTPEDLAAQEARVNEAFNLESLGGFTQGLPGGGRFETFGDPEGVGPLRFEDMFPPTVSGQLGRLEAFDPGGIRPELRGVAKPTQPKAPGTIDPGTIFIRAEQKVRAELGVAITKLQKTQDAIAEIEGKKAKRSPTQQKRLDKLKQTLVEQTAAFDDLNTNFEKNVAEVGRKFRKAEGLADGESVSELQNDAQSLADDLVAAGRTDISEEDMLNLQTRGANITELRKLNPGTSR